MKENLLWTGAIQPVALCVLVSLVLLQKFDIDVSRLQTQPLLKIDRSVYITL